MPGTAAYVCPKIPKQLIGHTEIAYKGPDAEPTLHLLGYAPKQDHIVRKTIHFSSRYPNDVFDDNTYVQVTPLPDDSPEITKFQKLLDIVRKHLEHSYFSAPQCDQVGWGSRYYPYVSLITCIEPMFIPYSNMA